MSLTFPLGEYRRLLGTYLRPQRGRVTLLAALLLGSVALQLVNPQIIRYFIDATQRRGAGAPLVVRGARLHRRQPGRAACSRSPPPT